MSGLFTSGFREKVKTEYLAPFSESQAKWVTLHHFIAILTGGAKVIVFATTISRS